MSFSTREAGVARLPHPILDLDSFAARSRDGHGLVSLTRLEFALLHHLAYLEPGKVATWASLAAAMHPFDKSPIGAKAIQFHINNIRRKVSRRENFRPRGAPWPWDVIVTVRGWGARLGDRG